MDEIRTIRLIVSISLDEKGTTAGDRIIQFDEKFEISVKIFIQKDKFDRINDLFFL